MVSLAALTPRSSPIMIRKAMHSTSTPPAAATEPSTALSTARIQTPDLDTNGGNSDCRMQVEDAASTKRVTDGLATLLAVEFPWMAKASVQELLANLRDGIAEQYVQIHALSCHN